MRGFLQAVSILTILPLGNRFPTKGDELARSMAFFPLVGLLVGLLLVLGHYLFSLIFPKTLVLWFTIGLLAFLTRGLHLDGLADTMDGLACGGSKEKILEVMRDSRIGAFGVLSLVFLIGGKFFALEQIPDSLIPQSLILMAVVGRNSMVLVCYHSPYARTEQGLGKPFTENLRVRELALSLLSAFGIALLFMGIKGILILLGIALFSLGYRLFFIKKVGGVTGDILGAVNELAELLCLLLIILGTKSDSL